MNKGHRDLFGTVSSSLYAEFLPSKTCHVGQIGQLYPELYGQLWVHMSLVEAWHFFGAGLGMQERVKRSASLPAGSES